MTSLPPPALAAWHSQPPAPHPGSRATFATTPGLFSTAADTPFVPSGDYPAKQTEHKPPTVNAVARAVWNTGAAAATAIYGPTAPYCAPPAYAQQVSPFAAAVCSDNNASTAAGGGNGQGNGDETEDEGLTRDLTQASHLLNHNNKTKSTSNISAATAAANKNRATSSLTGDNAADGDSNSSHNEEAGSSEWCLDSLAKLLHLPLPSASISKGGGDGGLTSDGAGVLTREQAHAARVLSKYHIDYSQLHLRVKQREQRRKQRQQRRLAAITAMATIDHQMRLYTAHGDCEQAGAGEFFGTTAEDIAFHNAFGPSTFAAYYNNNTSSASAGGSSYNNPGCGIVGQERPVQARPLVIKTALTMRPGEAEAEAAEAKAKADAKAATAAIIAREKARTGGSQASGIKSSKSQAASGVLTPTFYPPKPITSLSDVSTANNNSTGASKANNDIKAVLDALLFTNSGSATGGVSVNDDKTRALILKAYAELTNTTPPSKNNITNKSNNNSRLSTSAVTGDSSRTRSDLKPRLNFLSALTDAGIAQHRLYTKIRNTVFFRYLSHHQWIADVSKLSRPMLEVLTLAALKLPGLTVFRLSTASPLDPALTGGNNNESYNNNSASQNKPAGNLSTSLTKGGSPDDLSDRERSVAVCHLVPRVLGTHPLTLRHLELRSVTLTTAAWTSLAKYLKHTVNLRVFYLRRCGGLTLATLQLLLDALATLSVNHVAFSECNLGPQCVFMLSRFLEAQAQRREEYRWRASLRNSKGVLTTSSKGVLTTSSPPKGSGASGSAAQQQQKSASEQADAALTRVLSSQGLLSLDLSHNALGDAGLANLLTTLTADQWLLALDIRNNGADAAAVDAAVTLLSANTTLLSLKLDDVPGAVAGTLATYTDSLLSELDPFAPLRATKILALYASPSSLSTYGAAKPGTGAGAGAGVSASAVSGGGLLHVWSSDHGQMKRMLTKSRRLIASRSYFQNKNADDYAHERDGFVVYGITEAEAAALSLPSSSNESIDGQSMTHIAASTNNTASIVSDNVVWGQLEQALLHRPHFDECPFSHLRTAQSQVAAVDSRNNAKKSKNAYTRSVFSVLFGDSEYDCVSYQSDDEDDDDDDDDADDIYSDNDDCDDAVDISGCEHAAHEQAATGDCEQCALEGIPADSKDLTLICSLAYNSYNKGTHGSHADTDSADTYPEECKCPRMRRLLTRRARVLRHKAEDKEVLRRAKVLHHIVMHQRREKARLSLLSLCCCRQYASNSNNNHGFSSGSNTGSSSGSAFTVSSSRCGLGRSSLSSSAGNTRLLEDQCGLTSAPPYGPRGGGLLMPVLDLLCKDGLTLESLAHLKNSGRIRRVGYNFTEVRDSIVPDELFGLLWYREGSDREQERTLTPMPPRSVALSTLKQKLASRLSRWEGNLSAPQPQQTSQNKPGVGTSAASGAVKTAKGVSTPQRSVSGGGDGESAFKALAVLLQRAIKAESDMYGLIPNNNANAHSRTTANSRGASGRGNNAHTNAHANASASARGVSRKLVVPALSSVVVTQQQRQQQQPSQGAAAVPKGVTGPSTARINTHSNTYNNTNIDNNSSRSKSVSARPSSAHASTAAARNVSGNAARVNATNTVKRGVNTAANVSVKPRASASEGGIIGSKGHRARRESFSTYIDDYNDPLDVNDDHHNHASAARLNGNAGSYASKGLTVTLTPNKDGHGHGHGHSHGNARFVSTHNQQHLTSPSKYPIARAQQNASQELHAAAAGSSAAANVREYSDYEAALLLAEESDPLLSRTAAAAEEVYLDALVRNLERMTALKHGK